MNCTEEAGLLQRKRFPVTCKDLCKSYYGKGKTGIEITDRNKTKQVKGLLTGVNAARLGPKLGLFLQASN